MLLVALSLALQVNLLFVVDELIDDQDGKDALTTGNIFLNAMQDDIWNDQSVFSKMTKEFVPYSLLFPNVQLTCCRFRVRYLHLAGPRSTARFLLHWKDYCAAVVTEAELRERGKVLDVDSFIALRRENSAVRLCFSLIEACFGTELPDEVFENSAFMEIYWAAVDHVCWANVSLLSVPEAMGKKVIRSTKDLYSYDMEQSKGISGNNIMTVLMENQQMDLQAAADFVGAHCEELMTRFVTTQNRLPSWGSAVDSQIAQFIAGLGYWMKGNLE